LKKKKNNAFSRTSHKQKSSPVSRATTRSEINGHYTRHSPSLQGGRRKVKPTHRQTTVKMKEKEKKERIDEKIEKAITRTSGS